MCCPAACTQNTVGLLVFIFLGGVPGISKLMHSMCQRSAHFKPLLCCRPPYHTALCPRFCCTLHQLFAGRVRFVIVLSASACVVMKPGCVMIYLDFYPFFLFNSNTDEEMVSDHVQARHVLTFPTVSWVDVNPVVCLPIPVFSKYFSNAVFF